MRSMPRDGGSWPNIVTLDMEHKEVVIIEITSAADLRGLFDEITERQKHWFTPIRRSLESDRTIDSSWEIRFLGVVRETLVDGANAKFAGATDVHFSALERAAFSFEFCQALLVARLFCLATCRELGQA
jgi:hypothetical protein